MATVIVGIFIAVITSIDLRVEERSGRTRYVSGRPTVVPADRALPNEDSLAAVTGNAPWALSALPECFRQTREVRGPLSYVAPREDDAGFAAVPVGAAVRTADCTIVRRARSALRVTRGTSVDLRVAPVSVFSLRPPLQGTRSSELILVVRAGASFVLRRYRTLHAATLTRP